MTAPELVLRWGDSLDEPAGEIDLNGPNTGTYGDYDIAVAPNGADFGNPEPVRRILQAALLDGSASIKDRDDNRKVVLGVRVSAETADALAGGEQPLALADTRRCELVWRPPHEGAASAVFVVVAATLKADSTRDAEEVALLRYYTLELECLPHVYSDVTVTVPAVAQGISTPTTVDDCTAITGWTANTYGSTAGSAVTYVASAHTARTGAGVTSYAVTLPAGSTAWRYAVACIQVSAPATVTTVTAPAGWGTVTSASDPAFNLALWVFWRRLTGSETLADRTFTLSNSKVVSADVHVFSGGPTNTGPDGTGTPDNPFVPARSHAMSNDVDTEILALNFTTFREGEMLWHYASMSDSGSFGPPAFITIRSSSTERTSRFGTLDTPQPATNYNTGIGGFGPFPHLAVAHSFEDGTAFTTVSVDSGRIKAQSSIFESIVEVERFGTIDFSTQPYLAVEAQYAPTIQGFTGGAWTPIPRVGMDGPKHLYQPPTSVSALRFTWAASQSTVQYISHIDKQATTRTTGRQQIRTLAVEGAARTPANLKVESATAALDTVLLYTGPPYNPALSRGASGHSRTADTDTLSGARGALISSPQTGNDFILNSSEFPDGDYVFWARIRNSVAGTLSGPIVLTITQMDADGTTAWPTNVVLPSITVAPTFGSWMLVCLGSSILPVETLPKNSTAKTRFRVNWQDNDVSTVYLDELLAFNRTLGTLTIATGLGTNRALWLDGPSLDVDHPTVFTGTGAKESARPVSLLTALPAWMGTHVIEPPLTHIYTGVAGAGGADAAVSGTFRPAHFLHPVDVIGT